MLNGIPGVASHLILRRQARYNVDDVHRRRDVERCGPCNLAARSFQAIQDLHPSNLLVIGVNDDQDMNADIPEFAFRNNVHYPVVTRNGNVRDSIGTLAGGPTTFYIDRKGHVLHTITGAIPESLMETFAQDAICN